jgi:hypothetical protein
MNVNCDSGTHLMVKFLVALPIVIIYSLVIPLYVIISLLKHNSSGTLYHRNTLRRFGNFFFIYREKVFYFEIVDFLKRITFILIQLYFQIARITNDTSLKNACFTLLVHIYFFSRLYQYVKPYKAKHFNNINLIEGFSQKSLIITVFTASLWMSQLNEISEGLSLFLIFVALLSNLSFGIRWIQLKMKIKMKSAATKLKTRKIKYYANELKKRLNIIFKKENQQKKIISDFTFNTNETYEQKVKILEQSLASAEAKIKTLENINKLLAKRIISSCKDTDVLKSTNPGNFLTEDPLKGKQEISTTREGFTADGPTVEFKPISKQLFGTAFHNYALMYTCCLENRTDYTINNIKIKTDKSKIIYTIFFFYLIN